VGVLESTQEARRRWATERTERIEAEQASLTAKQDAAAEAERNKDRDERRERARRDARLNYLAKAKPLEATAIAANSAQTAFDSILSDPKVTVSTLYGAWAALQTATAVHAALRGTIETYQHAVSRPGQPIPARYKDSTPPPSFCDVLDRVVAARAASAASAAVLPSELFAKADQAGEQAAKAAE